MIVKLLSGFFAQKNNNHKIQDRIVFEGVHSIDLTCWWLDAFTISERKLIYEIFTPNEIELSGSSAKRPIFTISSFNITNEPILPFIENLSQYISKHDELANRVFLKYLELAQLDPMCDTEMLKTCKDYRNWFFARQMNFYHLSNYKKMDTRKVAFSYGNYEKAPDDCKGLDGKVFSVDSGIVTDHWGAYSPNCRCVLLPEIEEGVLID